MLLIVAVSISNAHDIPGRVSLQMDSQQQCEEKLATMKYWLKFDSFKVTGKCEKI
jgi:hypothetical protein